MEYTEQIGCRESDGGDCRGSEGGGKGEVEQRLAARELADKIRSARRVVGLEGRYECVSEYDPVLRSHCRLVEDRRPTR